MRKFTTYLGAALAVCLPMVALAQVSPIQLQIQGWWEQGGRPDEARDRYAHLRGDDARRYNDLQFQINNMQARIEQLQREQRHLLHMDNYHH